MRITIAVCIMLGCFTSSCDHPDPRRPAGSASADGTGERAQAEEPFFIAGGFSRGRGPDGNTAIFKAPDGLLVVDTGRHPGHSQEILNYAAAHGMPVTTIVNTHWHLDHSTGNAEIKAAYPEARLYTTRAIEGALDGFLANGARQGEEMLKNPDLSEKDRAEIERGLKTVRDRVGLLPDAAIDGPITLPVNGRDLELEVTDHAVTEADVWIWDPATKTVVAGDLVVLPAPFFDTACPAGWSRALAALAEKPFEKLIPGHGEIMSRAEFDIYRTAFDNLLACAADAGATDCSARWVNDAGALIAESDKAVAPQYIDYYVENIIRSEEKRAEFCGAAG